MNIQDTTRSLANAVSNIMAGHSIEKVELTEAKETTVPFEKMNILTPDQWDQVQNFKNFNEKEWKWNAIQKKFIRLKKIKEEDVEESNEFTAAAAKAKLAGKDEFEFDGKTYPVEIEQDAAEKILGKKESTDLEEAVKFWTVTITKKAGKLFKGQTVDVKASNSAEAIKKGLKQMKVDNPMTVPSGSADAVLAESLKEALKPSNGKSTIGLDVMEPERALKDMKKFKLKGKQGKGRNSDEVIVTGKNADIFKYLRSDYYNLDADEIEEFYPELFESVDLEEAIKPSNGKSTVGLEVMEPARALKDMKKFKLKGKQGKGENSNEVIVTGKNADIFKYLKSKAYGLDTDEIEDFYPELFESTDLEEAIVNRDIRIALELLKTTPAAVKFRNLIAKKDQDAKISASDLKKAKEVFANPNDKDKANIEKKKNDRYFPRFGVKALTEESVDLEEATMSQGVKTAATQIYSLEKSLKVGSNLNKGINKSLEGKYDADFKKMQKAIGDIINVWEEIERDFSEMNEVEEPKAQGEKDFKALHTISATDPEEAGNDQPIAPRP